MLLWGINLHEFSLANSISFPSTLLLGRQPSVSEKFHLYQRYFSAIGLLVITFLLCLISYRTNGQFLFFSPAFNYSLKYSNQPSPLRLPLENWISQATWLVFPALTFLSSIVTLIANRFWPRATTANSLGFYFQWCLILNFLTALYFDVKGSLLMLQSWHYASYLLPSTFLAIGSQLASLLDRLKPLQFFGITAVVAILSIAFSNSLFSNTLLIYTIIICLTVLSGFQLFTALRKPPQKFIMISLITLFLYLASIQP